MNTERDAEIAKGRKIGYSAKELAECWDISTQRVYQIATKINGKPKRSILKDLSNREISLAKTLIKHGIKPHLVRERIGLNDYQFRTIKNHTDRR